MAKDKQSFIAYADWKDTFEELPDKEAGQLIKHIFRYVNDENPEASSILIKAVFAPIKNTLKRDLKKWEKYVNKQSENGKKGGRPKKEQTQINPKNPTLILDNPNKPKKADSVSVSVSDNEINNKQKPQLSVEETFNLFWDHFHKITGKRKTDKDSALKKWKSIKSLEEKKIAYVNVKYWFDSIKDKGNDLQYVKKCRTYLDDKSYNDEFLKAKKQDPTKQLMDDIDVNHLNYDQMIGGEPLKKGKYAGMYFDNMNRTLSDKPLC